MICEQNKNIVGYVLFFVMLQCPSYENMCFIDYELPVRLLRRECLTQKMRVDSTVVKNVRLKMALKGSKLVLPKLLQT